MASISSQCRAITKAGTQCSRKAVAGSIFCKQHAGYTGSLAGEEEKKLAYVGTLPNEIPRNIPTPRAKTHPRAKTPPRTKTPPREEIIVDNKIAEVFDITGGLERLHLKLEGYITTEAFDEVDFSLDEDQDAEILEDTELLETPVGTGGVVILCPLGEGITIEKAIYYDQGFEAITLGDVIETILAEYNKPIDNELKELEQKAEDYGDQESLDNYRLIAEDLENDEDLKLYDLNFGLIRFTGLELVKPGYYRVLLEAD